jgi:CheY-like chemotaxis protein/HPt (histidine-containing phosphotransfer) domain-containing protein
VEDKALRELLALFVRDAPERLLRIEGHLAAFERREFPADRAAAAHEAHSLYGAAATLRLDALATLAQRLELMLEDGTNDGRALVGRARELLTTIRTEVGEIGDDGEEPVPAAGVVGVTQRTVLHVEDNPVNVKLIERALARRPRVRLLTATRADTGLRLAHAERPELILLDLHLPDASGREFLGRLRSDPATSGTAVVVVSADSRPTSLEGLGVRECLTKPVDIGRLLELVDELAPTHLGDAEAVR